MRSRIPAASREATRLSCSLLGASKQGDRAVKPPERYSSMDWSTKPQRLTTARPVTTKKKRAACARSNTSQTRDSSRGHDRYLYGDAAVGSINRSQAKKAYKEAAKAQREKVELRASEGEPYADEEEEAVTEESNTNMTNVSTRSTMERSLDLNERVGVVDENGNNQPFVHLQHQVTRPQQNSDISQLAPDAANQVWRRIGTDFDNGMQPLHTAPSIYNPFNQQTNPYMAMMAAPYRLQSTVPYYATSYLNTPFYNATMYGPQNFSSTPCQRYRERFVTEVATSMLTTLIDKAATFECCHEHCPDMSSGASRSVSAATIPALQSSSVDRVAGPAIHGIARPEAVYENCDSA